jgi:alpha-N-acetylglucosaminidase
MTAICRTVMRLLIFSMLLGVATLCRADLMIGAQAASQPLVLLRPGADPMERHAAEELARYCAAITGGAPLSIQELQAGGTPPAESWILIGSGSPEMLKSVLGKDSDLGDIDCLSNPDGFIIQSLQSESNKSSRLVLWAARPVACQYAVYHLLEAELNVGFAWFGDEHIPQMSTIRLANIHMREKPFFPLREYMQGCAFGYSTQFWDLGQWQAEIDWMVKKKLNLLHLTLGGNIPMYRTMRELGVEVTPPTPWDEAEGELIRQVIEYARQRGVRIVGPAFAGFVPPEFRQKYPKQRFVEVNWIDIEINQCLMPDDPMFRTVGEKFMRQYIAMFGTDHFYNIDPFPEANPGNTPEEKLGIKVTFAQSVTHYLQAADPEAQWVCSGWAFTDREVWPAETARAFLDAVPKSLLLINDSWADHDPLYKELNYFEGRAWGFGVLHSMGGWSTVHGDMADLIRRVHAVVEDPQAITRSISIWPPNSPGRRARRSSRHLSTHT